MRRRFALVLLLVAFLSASPPASGFERWFRPVAGPVAEPFRAPLTRFGKGHLGVDFAAAPGRPVRAAGPGTVAFAGRVAGARYVVVRHAGGLRTTYAFLASIGVRKGQVLARGAVVGTTGGRGENHEPDVLHFGLRIGDAYVDPMQLFGADPAPGDLSALVHLAPLDDSRPGPRSGPERLVPVGGRRIAFRALIRPGWAEGAAATLASLPDRSGCILQSFARP